MPLTDHPVERCTVRFKTAIRAVTRFQFSLSLDGSRLRIDCTGGLFGLKSDMLFEARHLLDFYLARHALHRPLPRRRGHAHRRSVDLRT